MSLVYLVYSGVDLYQFQTSPDSQLNQSRSRLEVLDVQLTKMKKKVSEAKEFQRELEEKRNQLRQLAGQLSEMKGSLEDEFDIPGLLKTISREAGRVGLAVTSLAPSKQVESEYYVERHFNLQFAGVYVQLMVFLDRLSNLKQILRVDSIRISPTGPQSARYVDLQGDLTILAYKYSGTDADQIGKAEAKNE